MMHINPSTALIALLLSSILGIAQAQLGPQPRLPVVEIQAGMHRIRAEVARTPQQQTTGMMFRAQMGTHEGMLFVNDTPEPRCFWMRNTLIPLAIAFLDDDGTVVNTAEMQAGSDRSHCSTKPVRFALEMNQGWFERRGIKAGSKLRGPVFAP